MQTPCTGLAYNLNKVVFSGVKCVLLFNTSKQTFTKVRHHTPAEALFLCRGNRYSPKVVTQLLHHMPGHRHCQEDGSQTYDTIFHYFFCTRNMMNFWYRLDIPGSVYHQFHTCLQYCRCNMELHKQTVLWLSAPLCHPSILFAMDTFCHYHHCMILSQHSPQKLH